MNGARLFFCAVAGVTVATTASFLFGASGLLSYRQLQAYERRLDVSITTLAERNLSLERRLTALRTNPELLRLYARELGYYRPHEIVLRVTPGAADPIIGASEGSPFGSGRYPGAEHYMGTDAYALDPVVQRRVWARRDPFSALTVGMLIGAASYLGVSLCGAVRRHRRPAAVVSEQPPGGGADAPAA